MARGVFGVVVLWFKKRTDLQNGTDGILELIGNRIGVATENIILAKKYLKSKERYRILFNNIPHSLFLLDGKDYTIVDSNVRAQSAYGYTKEELPIMLGVGGMGDALDWIKDGWIQASIHQNPKAEGVLRIDVASYILNGLQTAPYAEYPLESPPINLDNVQEIIDMHIWD